LDGIIKIILRGDSGKDFLKRKDAKKGLTSPERVINQNDRGRGKKKNVFGGGRFRNQTEVFSRGGYSRARRD